MKISAMKKTKKFLSLLIISVLSAVFLSAFFGSEIANADIFDSLSDLFSTSSGQTGQSFEQFTPGDDLTLSEEGINESLTTESDLKSFILRIVNFALSFLGLFAVLIVIYGGVLYVSAAGEEERATKGKTAITYATIGLLIILGSFAFVNTILSGAQDGGGGVTFTVGENVGRSFNATSEQAQEIASDIYNDFLVLADASEEFKGIFSELEKPSLKFETTLVSKQNMLNFLFKTKESLINTRAKSVRFSGSYVAINSLISEVDIYMDEVRIAGGLMQLKPDGQGGVIKCEAGFDVLCPGYTEYPFELLGVWSQEDGVVPSLTSSKGDSKSLSKVTEAIRIDLRSKIISNVEKLAEIRQSLTGIEVVETGGIGKVYEEMMDAYGYDPTNPQAQYTGVMKALEAWQLTTPTSEKNLSQQVDDNILSLGTELFKALKLNLEFADELRKLQSVDARLRASVTSGNAPLVVTFDILGSLDPAGGSIVDKNIDWSNLTGSMTYEGEPVAVGSEAVTCPTDINEDLIDNEDLQVFGPSFRQCIFNYPGTYVASVTIHSNDKSKFVSGKSSLVIRVNPPTTLINMDMVLPDATAIPIMEYYENGLIKTNENYIAVALSEAEKGLTFNASTKPSNAINYKWNFGDGATIDTDQGGSQKHAYETEGKYTFELEVLNNLNQLDRKIFTLDVRDVAARIRIAPPEDVFINTPILIDGTSSASSGGIIRSYEWSIKDNDTSEELDLGTNRNKAVFRYEFEDPGLYTVRLKVTSDFDTFTIDKEVEVRSLPPVAEFDYKVVNSGQPGTILFNPDKSYDPDGEEDDLEYKWNIKPSSDSGAVWRWIDGSNLSENIYSESPTIKFRKVGEYDVTLEVRNTSGIEEYDIITKKVVIDNVLDVSWAEDQDVTAQIDEEGKATINFKIESENAVAYEINFGDGNISTGDIKNSKTIPHSYTKAGQFTVEVTVFDEMDNDNSTKRRVFIGDSDTPVAKIGLVVSGVEISDLSEVIEVTKKDIVTFDGSESKNIDGTGRKLRYNWDFGDTGKSSSRTATHTYTELSPKDPGYFTVTLKVFDEDNPTKTSEDEIRIRVVNKPPSFSSIQAIPDSVGADLVTPVTVNLTAFGVQDDDGRVTQYKWWYYNVNNPDNPLGIRVTQSPTTSITLGTSGVTGEEVTYGFGLSITDNDNLTTSSLNTLAAGQVPKITVKNGPNELPIAKFRLDATKVFTGDAVTFSSSSTDPDGKIISYIWDFEGDGFFNNEPTQLSSIEHTYTQGNLTGYSVRLKVIDDKGGESVSEPVKVFVEALAEPPKAAFTYKVIDSGAVIFQNNSTVDINANATIKDYIWDFDTQSTLTSADSDGDGSKSNDNDSSDKDPIHQYLESGIYMVKLTVLDDQGNTDEVVNEVNVTVGLPITTGTTTAPVSQLAAVLKSNPAPSSDGIIYLEGNSGSITFDFTDSVGSIANYVFDKNIYFDTNGNGINTDDQDFKTILPGRWTTNFGKEWGKIVVKLTVVDIYGNENSTIQEVKFK